MKSFPFDSEVTYTETGDPIYDRASNSQELRDYFHLMYTDGVFPNPSTGMQVVAYSEEMSVAVMPGNVIIRGAFGIEENNRILVFEASGSTYDRIDAVVARLNTNHDYRKIDLYVVKGVEAESPVAPELTREGGIYELRLANVFIAKNTTSITTERITDTRLNTEDCGIVTCNPQVVDTTDIFSQYQASLDKYLQYVRECIDGTTAGNLQNKIDDLNSNLTASDNTPFRFGVNEDGEYGYIVTDSEGADTVIPFSNVKKLYQALQYSGLVTEDMTFAEMCDALAAAYPATYSLLMSEWSLSYSTSGLTANGVCSTSAVKMTITNQTTTASTHAYYTSPEFDITAYKTLSIIGTSHRAAYNANTGYNPLLYLVDASGNLTQLFKHSSIKGGSSENISINRDVSALTGKYRLRIDILSYCGGTPSESNVSSNVGAYINLTKALLTA